MIYLQPIGGLCNQMFQTAFVYAYAKKHNLDYRILNSVIHPHIKDKVTPYKFRGFKYETAPAAGVNAYHEQYFHYYDIPKMDNVCFYGYFQSAKYFDEYRDDIIDRFGLKWEMNEGVVSVHYRSGDYKHQQNFHPVVDDAYIEKAIYRFVALNYFKFHIFSDEIEQIKKIIEEPGRFPNILKFSYPGGADEIEDLILASSCEHNIGSNSAYSWWIHYLNRNEKKIGIFPEKNKWFGPELPHNVDDLYSEKWETI